MADMPTERIEPPNDSPLDLPPLVMTDDEWRDWCATLGIHPQSVVGEMLHTRVTDDA